MEALVGGMIKAHRGGKMIQPCQMIPLLGCPSLGCVCAGRGTMDAKVLCCALPAREERCRGFKHGHKASFCGSKSGNLLFLKAVRRVLPEKTVLSCASTVTLSDQRVTSEVARASYMNDTPESCRASCTSELHERLLERATQPSYMIDCLCELHLHERLLEQVAQAGLVDVKTHLLRFNIPDRPSHGGQI